MTSSSNTDSAVTSVFELTSVGLEENRWRDGAQALGKYSRTEESLRSLGRLMSDGLIWLWYFGRKLSPPYSFLYRVESERHV